VWLAGSGMLITGLFFIGHLTAVYDGNLQGIFYRAVVHWYLAIIPVILLPFIWYAAMLWFAGYWESPEGQLRRRHRVPLGTTAAIGLVIIGFCFALIINGAVFRGLGFSLAPWELATKVANFLLYVVLYITICFVLAIDAMRQIEPSGRMMGDLARHRARPWLLSVSVIQLVVCVVVAAGVIVAPNLISRFHISTERDSLIGFIAWVDLGILLLIGISLFLVGNAIVSYEIFTGKILPRRGLRRHWHRTILWVHFTMSQ
jgi:hypothetical protein